MIVISDTSPINYLVLIGEIDLLAKLYHTIIIPPTVFDELTADASPAKVGIWLKNKPDWLLIKNRPHSFRQQFSGLMQAKPKQFSLLKS